MINRKVQVVSASGLPSGIRYGAVGILVRILGDASVYDVEVKFSRNRTEYFELHELRYINGRKLVIRTPAKKTWIGRQVRLKKTCLFYHPDECIVKINAVDAKLRLLTVHDGTGCAFAVYFSEVTKANGHRINEDELV